MTKRKTLRDYLLMGGILGQVFQDKHNSYYKVWELEQWPEANHPQQIILGVCMGSEGCSPREIPQNITEFNKNKKGCYLEKRTLFESLDDVSLN